MKRLCVALATLAALVAPAAAHNGNDVTPRKAGPIVRNETTLGQLKGWFGDPSAQKTKQVGCVDVISARWGGKLKVYADEQFKRVAAIFVRARKLSSTVHGTLWPHTKRLLRVGDSKSRLEELYPGANPMHHSGHTHYQLRTGKDGGRLLAKVVNGRVTQLEVWPYEFC